MPRRNSVENSTKPGGEATLPATREIDIVYHTNINFRERSESTCLLPSCRQKWAGSEYGTILPVPLSNCNASGYDSASKYLGCATCCRMSDETLFT